MSSTLRARRAKAHNGESLHPDGKGGYWLCEEYGPFLINIDSKGKIQAIHGPQAAEGEKAIAGGLPNFLKWQMCIRDRSSVPA